MPEPIFAPAQINQYAGVNAHVHDRLQEDGFEWKEFHGHLLIYLQNDLNKALRERGYVARMVPGLQIRPIEGEGRWSTPEPDVALYDITPQRTVNPLGAVSATAVREFIIPTDVAEEDYYPALEIYKTGARLGKDKPITHIELLSPSNKPKAHLPTIEAQDVHWMQYRRNRQVTLQAEIALVEIDLISWELPLPNLKPYVPIRSGRVSNLHIPEASQGHPPYPYMMLITTPNDPALLRDKTYVYGAYADEPLPSVNIPLAKSERLSQYTVQTAYDQTVQAVGFPESIDYRQLPVHFDHYRPDDQDRIAARILAIQAAHQQGALTADQREKCAVAPDSILGAAQRLRALLGISVPDLGAVG